MDKLFNKSWFIKLSSVAIAVMLFLMVNMENQQINQAGGGLPGITDGERVEEDVPLNVYYDEDNYVLTEAPETVQVTMRGPQNVLTVSQITQGQQEVFIDLEDAEAGTHYERIEHAGFPTDLRVSIVPMTVSVTLQERVTSSFPVEVELVNEDDVAEGYVPGEPLVEPASIDVTGASGVIDQISTARVVVDVGGAEDNISTSASVDLLDETGNEIDVTADPPAVDVTVPITSPNIEVPVRVGRSGELNQGMALNGISTDPEMVTVFGPVEVLNEISFIDIDDVDLGQVNGDSSFEAEVPLPEGAERVEPDTVTVNVDTTAEEDREFVDFPIEAQNVPDGMEVDFPTNENGTFTLIAQASINELDRVSREDFEAVVDLGGLSEGAHNVPLELNGPQNIRLPQQGSDISVVLSGGEDAAVETNEEPEEDINEENENEENNENNDNNEENGNEENENSTSVVEEEEEADDVPEAGIAEQQPDEGEDEAIDREQDDT
ncbi:CdaR family protein [Alkalicoccus chagannorensis]|uniref:CdaR family protein n=1 Tax=Alkalicoccus chagannorensis TaxID=427072 RepID=UPI00041ABE56|nr:CdaR family protein [Alkalicoccus chagannorensis]